MMRKLFFALGFFLGLTGAAFATCGSDTVPVAALKAGLTQQTFCDDFTTLDTIDTTGSNTSGYNWYPGQAWPRAAQTAGWTKFPSVSPTYFSIVEDGLKIEPTTFYGGPVLESCYPVSDPPYIDGHVFANGFYLTVTASWKTKILHPKKWPAAWMFPSEFLVGGTSSPLTIIELDNEEAPYGRHFHLWQFSGGVGDRHDFTITSTVHSGIEYGLLVVPADLNDGSPTVEYYTSGQSNPITVPNPPPYGGFPEDTLTLATTQHMCILLNAHNTWPMTVRKVAIWQSPPPTK